MISWYIKYNKKFYIASMVGLVLVGIIMFYLYFPKYSLFAIYAFTMMLAITYVDTITQIRRYLESNNAKAWLVRKWQLKDSLTYTTFVIVMIVLGAVVIHFSPPNIPGSRLHYTTAIAFSVMAVFKWLRYFEMKRETREGNVI